MSKVLLNANYTSKTNFTNLFWLDVLSICVNNIKSN